MEKKYLRQFYNLFDCLSKAGGILSNNINLLSLRNNYYRDVCFAKKSITEVIEFPVQSDLMSNLLKEIETNLYQYPESRIIYLKDIIRPSERILLYLKNTRDERHCSQNLSVISKLIKDYSQCKFDINDLSIIEQYVLSCHSLISEFSCLLAAKCVTFEIDLMEIQKDLKIFLFDGNIPYYFLQLNYEEKFKCTSPRQTKERTEIPELSFQMNYWDSFEDRLTDKYEKEGIAELERFYIKNSQYMITYTAETDRDRTKVPIVAKGFLAYLCDYINKNFQGIQPPNYNFDHLYQAYFDHCIKFSPDNEKMGCHTEPYKFKIDLILHHRTTEQQLLAEPHRFYYEVSDESERPNVEKILHEASKYWEWIQETYIESPIRENRISKIFFEKLPVSSSPLKANPSQHLGYEDVESGTNIFCQSMPLNLAVSHFKLLTETKSLNGKPFLMEDQLKLFIRRAFCGDTELPIQNFNQSPKGDKLHIQKIFHDFYCKGVEYFPSSRCRDLFIRLLTDNFIGWDFDNVKSNFSK